MLGRDYPAETLQVGDAEKAKIALYDALIHLDEIERELSAAEQRIWQPHWRKDDPLRERLRRVGVTDSTANTVVSLICGWEALRCGKPLPAEANVILDGQERAELSANEQLNAIVKSRRSV
jgi:hypothetical protein